MKIALCTTTINVPEVLKLYRECDASVKFFVALDQNSPFQELAKWGPSDDRFCWMTPHWQGQYKCSEPIGWRNIQRRNLAFLEALKWGADIVVSCDDDNAPLERNYFDHYEFGLSSLWSGLKLGESGTWFDVGQLQFPNQGGIPVVQRGFPQSRFSSATVTHAVRAKVGVMQGICLGDPDTSAVDRISKRPLVHNVSELLRAGFVTDNHCYAPFNSQNSAIVRELVPAWFMWPGVQRYDDIFASLLTQRVMREYDYYVRWGRPFVWQSRNDHDLNKDLRGEIDGMENVLHLAEVLDSVQLAGKTVLEDCRRIWGVLQKISWVPERTTKAAFSYLDDCAEFV